MTIPQLCGIVGDSPLIKLVVFNAIVCHGQGNQKQEIVNQSNASPLSVSSTDAGTSAVGKKHSALDWYT